MIREYFPGMGQAVADRTVNRKIDGRVETWGEVAARVSEGNALLDPRGPLIQSLERQRMQHHLEQASLLMSGRHLQHGDASQPSRNMEVFTNCSTAATTFLLFYLLLNGSGVGRAYDDAMISADLNQMPIVVPVVDWSHPDVNAGLITGFLTKRDAEHLYAGRKITVFDVPDSREGWAKAIEVIERMAYEGRREEVLIIEFTGVRERGAPIMGMQGRPASGPGPLMNAIASLAKLRDAGMEPWRAAIYADHYVAECVLVGGARRAARMATKHWKDATIFGFIELKRGGFLWSSNNSVTIDGEFRARVEKVDRHVIGYPSDEVHNVLGMLVGTGVITSMDRHAYRVLLKLAEAAYHDGTGEPGIINQDKLTQNDEGLDYDDGLYAESSRFKIDEATLPLMRELGRTVMGLRNNMITNPCGEITLLMLGGYCVDGDTRILHRNGYGMIRDLVGKTVEVWNGEEWSNVEPRLTGTNQKLLRVSFSDGSSLDCTPYHKFSVRGTRQGDAWHEVEARDLHAGAIMPNFRVDFDIGGEAEKDAYTYGAFLGDGSIEQRSDNGRDRFTICLYTGKHHLPVKGSRGSEKANKGICVTVSHLDHARLRSLKEDGLPEWIFGLDRPSTLDFVRGWVDTDGLHHKDTGGISISTSKMARARDLQLLLRRAGFSFVSVRQAAQAGDLTNFGPRTEGLWTVYVPASEASMLNGYRVATSSSLDLDKNVKQQRVVSVIEVDGVHDTFCFTEHKRHMGVFGNVLTYQCVIADVVPFHAANDDDAEDSFRVATRALIRTNLMDCLYSREVKRTNRIGVGITGFHEWAYDRFGFTWYDIVDEDKSREMWLTLSRFKRAIVEEAAAYSKELGVVAPHTDTTFKPAGTTSKLFGLTEGAHLPSMREFIRWVQFRNDDPLVKQYEDLGYPVKHLRTYEGTTVVGFPTKPKICELDGGAWVVTAAEATPEEQYQFLRLLEKYWIRGVAEDGVTPLAETGNQVSYTLKYDPTKVDFRTFLRTLIDGQFSIRCCSVMPQADTSAYEYQPEQPVTKAEFEMIAAAIANDDVEEDIGFEHVDCGSGACPIDFGAKAA